MTSWSLTLGPSVPEKSSNRVKSSYSFHWKLKEDRALILIDLDSLMTKYFPLKTFTFFWFWPSSGGKLRSKLGQKFKLWVCLVSVKIQVFQNTLNGICTIMRTTCDQKFTSIWPCLLELLPWNPSKWNQMVLNQKKVVVSSE